MTTHRRRITSNGGAVLRVIGAFVAGLLLGWLASKIGAGVQNVLPLLLFPLLIGIAGVFTIGTRQRHPYLVALGSSLIAWIGVGTYFLASAGHGTSAACASEGCGNEKVITSLLILYFLVGLIPLALGSLITSVVTRFLRRSRPQPL